MKIVLTDAQTVVDGLVSADPLRALGEVTEHGLLAYEEVAEQIADAVMKEADAEGVGVVIRAKHLCMMMRGVEKQNSEMVTSAVLGSFRSDEKVRGEFLSLVNN